MALNTLRAAVLAALTKLRETTQLSPWQTAKGTRSRLAELSNETQWEDVQRFPYSWSSRDAARTFRHQLTIPTHIHNIPTAGASFSLEVFSAIGARVFVDDELVYHADYWADTQVVPVMITPKLEGGEEYNLEIECRQGDGFGLMLITEARISSVDEWIFTLDTFAEELKFAAFLIEHSEVDDPLVIAAFHSAVSAFDLSALEQSRWSEVQRMIEAVRVALKPFSNAAKRYTIHMVGHAHIDMNWLWPWSETKQLIVRDFESIAGIMDDYPQVCFSHSQAVTYQTIHDDFPSLWQRVQAKIKQGTWDVTAATWVEGDLNMGGYETMARQFLLGKRYSRQHTHVDPILCWEPDTFGHPATMPHILNQAGMTRYYFMRAGWGERVFWWEGTDNVRVLAYNDASYNSRIFATIIIDRTIDLKQRYGLRDTLFVYGIGDHGGGVTRADVSRAIRLNDSSVLPIFRFAKTDDFYSAVEHGIASGAVTIPTYVGELNTVFEGCYTTHGDIKWVNRYLEHALVQAEVLAVMANLERKVVQDGLRDAWRRQCFNQFHDIICGSAIHQTYAEDVPAAHQAIDQTHRLLRRALAIIANKPTDSTAVTVYNTVSWERSDVVWLSITDYPSAADWQNGDLLQDSQGNTIRLQRAGEAFAFIAEHVPAFGHKTYHYLGAAGEAPTLPFGKSEMNNPTLENANFRLEVDLESGTIISLVDKRSRRELSYFPQGEWIEHNKNKGLLNLFEIAHEAPHPMSAWKIGTVTRTERLVANAQVTHGAVGPVYQSLHITHQHAVVTLRQEIRMYQGIDRIDFINHATWLGEGNDSSDAPMLRVIFAPKLKGTLTATHDIPFGTIERTPDGREYPALHWVDISTPDYGMSLFNDSRYGHSIQGTAMALTLIRSSYEPDNRPDVGEHRFNFAILPHTGGWQSAQVERHGYGYNQPLWGHLSTNAPEVTDTGFIYLEIGDHESGTWSPAANIMVTALKPAEDGDDHTYILRLVEMHGKTSAVRVKLGFEVSSVQRVNLIEDVLETLNHDGGSIIKTQIAANAILTLKVKEKTVTSGE